MKKLVLNEKESQKLLDHGAVEIERNGLPMLIEKNPYFDEDSEENYLNKRYTITIYDCYEKIVIKSKRKN